MQTAFLLYVCLDASYLHPLTTPTQLLKFGLSMPFDINEGDVNGKTALHHACENGATSPALLHCYAHVCSV